MNSKRKHTMIYRLNISVPPDLYVRYQKHKTKFNLSKLCQVALEKELDNIEQWAEYTERVEAAFKSGEII